MSGRPELAPFRPTLPGFDGTPVPLAKASSAPDRNPWTKTRPPKKL
ncbi:hypothetical protein [Streptomyces similanensis]